MFITTQKQLAEKAGYSTTQISLFKHRKDDGHSEEFTKKIASIIGVDPLKLERASRYARCRMFDKFIEKQRELKKQ